MICPYCGEDDFDEIAEGEFKCRICFKVIEEKVE